MKEVIVKYFKINMRDIAYIKSILESYEGMALIRTADRDNSIMEVWINPHFSEIINSVLVELAQATEMLALDVQYLPAWAPAQP